MKRFINQSIIVGKQIPFSQQFNLTNLVAQNAIQGNAILDIKRKPQNGRSVPPPSSHLNIPQTTTTPYREYINEVLSPTYERYQVISQNTRFDNGSMLSADQKSSTFFPKIIRNNPNHDNNTIIEEKIQYERTISQGSTTRHRKSYSNQKTMASSNSHPIIDQAGNASQISKTQENPAIAYQNIQHNSALTSIALPVPSQSISPEKKSFRIKYSQSIKRSSQKFERNNDSTLDKYQVSVKQPSTIIDLKSMNSQISGQSTTDPYLNNQSQMKKHHSNQQSNAQSSKEFIQLGPHVADKPRLVEALNVQPLQQKKNQQMTQIKQKYPTNPITQVGTGPNDLAFENYLNKNLKDDTFAPTVMSHYQSIQQQNNLNNDQILKAIKENQTRANQMSTLTINKNNKETIQGFIKEKQEELNNETIEMRNRIQEQQGVIKHCILHKSNLNIRSEQNSIISDFRKKRHISPQKPPLPSDKNKYFRIGNGMHGELVPLAGITTNMQENQQTFYVTPNIAYESLLANPGLQNLHLITQKTEMMIGRKFDASLYLAQTQMLSNNIISGTSIQQPVGTKNSLLSGMLASRKEQVDLKNEIEMMRQNKKYTDEMLKDCLFKNDKLSFEALNHLNSIIQSQRALKDRLKVANGMVGSQISYVSETSSVDGNKGSESPFQLIRSILEAKAIKEIKDGELSSRSASYYEENQLHKLITRTLENYRTQQNNSIKNPTLPQTQSTPRTQVKSTIIRNSVQNQISPQQTSKMKDKTSPRAPLNLHPEPRITIYHTPSDHLNDHPINKAISKINYIIKLIFKAHKELPTMNQSSIVGLNQNLNNQPQHVVEEAKFNEIQRMAKQFNITIPKRFDNKTAHREYFSSKEFIVNIKTKMNAMLHQAINESNGMTQILAQYQNNGSGVQVSQKFYIGRGNNDAAVRSVLKQRSWWIQHTDEDFEEVNFLWTQWKKQKHIDYLANNGNNSTHKSLKFYNKMEQNKQLTNKKGVFINMREYYLSMEQDPFEILPLTFLVKSGVNDPEFRRFQDYFNNLISKSKQIELQRAEALQLRNKQLQEIKDQKELERQQKNNSLILPNLKKKKASYVSDESDDDDDDSNYSDENHDHMGEQDEEIKEIKRKFRVPKNVWIIKPGENTNRGNGINVSSNLNEIKSLVQKANTQKEKTYIIQKYIDYPLLINNRKFDFRCYGIMTSINGNLKGYFYEDAYIRTSCKEFDIDNLANKYIHLTNDAVQKHSQDYGKFENGNKMSLSDFQRYLKGAFPGYQIDIKRDLMPQIKKLITDSYRAAYGKIDPGRLHNSFELFGYDFMLDEDFRLYLIEVNTNPCLEMSSPLLARIIPEVLDNAFRLILDPIFPSPDLSNVRKYSINEIPQELKFTLVFDEQIDGPDLRKLQNKFSGIKEEIESDEEEELNKEENEEEQQESLNDKTID